MAAGFARLLICDLNVVKRLQISVSSPNDFGGNAAGNGVWGEVLGYDGSGCDDATIANTYASRDYDFGAEPNTIADSDIAISFGLMTEGDVFFELVVGRCNKNIGSE